MIRCLLNHTEITKAFTHTCRFFIYLLNKYPTIDKNRLKRAYLNIHSVYSFDQLTYVLSKVLFFPTTGSFNKSIVACFRYVRFPNLELKLFDKSCVMVLRRLRSFSFYIAYSFILLFCGFNNVITPYFQV